MERSVYIIKPEALHQRERIHKIIRGGGLRIVATKTTMADERVVCTVYPDLSGDLRSATVHHFGVGPCEIGVVEGEDAIARLSALAGEYVDPSACGAETIRGRFGLSVPVRFGSCLYYRNGFHRSRNASEAKRELDLFAIIPAGHYEAAITSNPPRKR